LAGYKKLYCRMLILSFGKLGSHWIRDLDLSPEVIEISLMA
jgi:hypothetical protein